MKQKVSKHVSNIKLVKHYMFFGFTLYPAYSRVSRGNLVFRHPTAHFLMNFGDIAC